MRNRYSLPVFLFSFALAGCSTGADETTAAQRGSIPKADLVGSCVDSCGGEAATGNCWCDVQCVELGDCCEDFAEVCEPEELGTCVDSCGAQGVGGDCWCDAECVALGDCCPDYAEVCEVELTGSCVDSCGGQSLTGSCYCDLECSEAGDCCSDFIEICAVIGSCVDSCGGATSDGFCWCDDQCLEFGDCCTDYALVCEVSEQSCGGFAGLTCGAGEYCHFEIEDTCGFADALGVCRPQPEFCLQVFAPVCGCDGQTYGNDCEAAAAGVSVLHEGECLSPE